MADRLMKLLIIGLLSSVFAQAQEAKPLPRHPGDIIKYEIKFDGPNADKIKTVFARMNTNIIPKDQIGFTGQLNTLGQIPVTPPSTVVEMKIPDNIATGEYRLYISAIAAEGSGDYADGQEFNVPVIHIENPRTFTPPGINVKPLP